MAQEFKREEILNKPLTRSMAFRADGENSDAENRSLELSFSSDNPVYHWFGYVILDHSEGSARLDRINQGGALLWAHNRNQQIGGVSNVRLDGGKGRALVKFSRGAMGEEKFRDVQDEICQTVSFGFYIYGLDPEVGQDGKQMEIDGEYVYRSRDWEPFEISLEPIPADTSVGVGRSLELEPEDRKITE